MNNNAGYYLKLIFRIIHPYVLVALSAFLLFRFTLFFLPFVLAFIVAWITNPLIKCIQNRLGMKRRFISIFTTIAVLLAVCFVVWLIASGILNLILTLTKALPSWGSNILATVNVIFSNISDLPDFLPADIETAVSDLRHNIVSFVTRLITGLARPTMLISITAVKSAPDVFISVLMFFLASFTFINEWDSITAFIRHFLPEKVVSVLERFRTDLKKIFGSWLIAQFRIMFIVFLVLAVSFTFIKVNYAIPLALLTAFLDFLPALGVGFIMWPWMVVELLTGKYLMFLALGLIYVLTQVVRNTLQPRIMGDSMGLPPHVSLIFMFTGYRLYGFTGLIFALPIGMMIICLFRYGIFDGSIKAAKELFSGLFS